MRNIIYRTSNFNAWDEEWEVGAYDSETGEKTTIGNKNKIRSKNRIKVVPGSSYYFRTVKNYTSYICTYNDAGFVSHFSHATNHVFTVPNGVKEITFYLGTSYGTTYNNDICINLSQPDTSISPHNGDYVPYDKGQNYKVLETCGQVDLGSLNWGYDGYIMYVNNVFNDTNKARFVNRDTVFKCKSTYANGIPFLIVYGNEKGFCVSADGKSLYCNTAGEYVNPNTFKQAMSGVILTYELANPATYLITETP